MRMIKFSGNISICTVLDKIYIFVEDNGKRKTFIFPGPFGVDSWTFMDPEDAERFYPKFDILVMKLWVDHGRDPWSWTRYDICNLLESLDGDSRAEFVSEIQDDVEPEELCAFAHKFPEAFSSLDPDWVRQYNPEYEPQDILWVAFF